MSEIVALELKLPKSTYNALQQAAEQKRKSAGELALDAIQVYLEQPAKIDPLLGLFADDPDLMDEIVADAMRSRENSPLRLAAMTDG